MAAASDVLKVAREQIGVTEYPPQSNNVKYNTEYYNREVYGDETYPWCMVFVWWVFKHAGASDLFYDGGKTASCPTFYWWASRTGRWYTSDYKPGDIAIFRFSSSGYDHTGIVEQKNADGTYYVIEGNTSLTSDDNGGAVMRRTRYPSQFVGCYRPDYRNVKPTPEKEPEKPAEQEKPKDQPKEEEPMTQKEFNAMLKNAYKEFVTMYKRARDDVDPFYANLEDVPIYWQPEVESLMKVGAIKGDGVNSVGKRRSELQAMIPAARYVDWYFGGGDEREDDYE